MICGDGHGGSNLEFILSAASLHGAMLLITGDIWQKKLRLPTFAIQKRSHFY